MTPSQTALLQFQAALDAVHDGSVVFGADRRVLSASGPAAAALRLDPEELVGLDRGWIATRLALLAAEAARELGAGIAAGREGDCEEPTLDGPPLAQDGIDPATGLRDRVEGALDLARAAMASARCGFPLSVARFDLQGPSPAAVARLLPEAAGALLDAARQTDAVARWSAGGFIVVLHHCDLAGARSFVERVLLRAEAGCWRESCGVWLTGGVAQLAPDDDALRMLHRAEAELGEGGRPAA